MKLDTHRLLSELQQNGLNQSDLGRKLGIPRQSVFYMIKHPHKVKLSRISAIAGILNIDPKSLIVADKGGTR